MNKFFFPLFALSILFVLAGCQKTLGEPGDGSIRNATLIDTSKVSEIGTLLDDKLTAFRHQGEVLFTSEILNSDASGYNTVSYYDTEFGYIDCNTNKFHKVGEVVPLFRIDTFASEDRRYIYYVYAEFPKGVPYPKTQEEYNKLLEATPTSILQYDIKTKKTKKLELEVFFARYSLMNGQKIFVNSIGCTVGDGDIPEKPRIAILDFETEEVQILYDGNEKERELWFTARAGSRYIFSPNIHDTENPSVRIFDTEDFSETILPLDIQGKDEYRHREFENIGDVFYLYTSTDKNRYDGLCKYVPTDNRFEKQDADPNELLKLYTYYSQATEDLSDKNSEQFFTITNIVNGGEEKLTIAIDGFTPPPLGHGNLLYPTTGENFILCSGTDLIWEWLPISTLQTDYQFFYVTGNEIARALGTEK